MSARSKLTTEDVLALLNERLETYEHRPQQIELAHGIERTFKTQQIGLYEAGTGIGKSFAALIPAILSGKKVVVSTNTIALQEQYINKDIPALKAILPFNFEAALMKGRGNYVGLRRFDDHLLEQAIDEEFVDWVRDTATGDISELDFVPTMDVWLEVNSDSDDCLRNRCPRFNDCFYFEARRRAEKADILVVNHALLLADAASLGNILPQYDLLIVDEAHHLPDVATDVFSNAISNRGVRMAASKALKRVQAPIGLIRDLELESTEFFHRLAYAFPAMKTRVREPIDGAHEFALTLRQLKKWLEDETFETVLDVGSERERARLKAKAIISTLAGYINCLELMAKPDPNWVLWVEKGDNSFSKVEVVAAPLDVSGYIHDNILDKSGLSASVWMSATLATGGEDPFGYFKRSCGMEGQHVIQSKVSSPFDFEKQALLYLPRTLPEPNTKEFTLKAADEIARILEFSEGRAFVLFTSRSSMNQTFEYLAHQLPYPAKRQGEMPRKKLVEWFRETPQAVLFATATFWEGVSVEGEQLSCVIIDRIPFQSPDDPVYEAKCEAMKEEAEWSWFNALALPHATMRLKQGVGRLIRTKKDVGIVAILDSRMTGKGYGRRILECLPGMRVVRTLDRLNSLSEYFASRTHDTDEPGERVRYRTNKRDKSSRPPEVQEELPGYSLSGDSVSYSESDSAGSWRTKNNDIGELTTK